MSKFCDRKKLEKVVQRQIDNVLQNGLPILHALKIYKPIQRIDYTVTFDSQDTFSQNDLLMVKIVVLKEDCEKLLYDYVQTVAFIFPDDYPFVAPSIELEEFLVHKLVDENSEIKFPHFNPVFNLSQQIMHVYLIILQAINDPVNNQVVEDWNEKYKDGVDLLFFDQNEQLCVDMVDSDLNYTWSESDTEINETNDDDDGDA